MNNSSESYYTLTTIDHVNSYKKYYVSNIIYSLSFLHIVESLQ